MKKRSVQVVVLAVLSLLLVGPVPNSLARPPALKEPAKRALPKAIEEITEASAAYGTGTVVHADALRAGANSLLGLDVAFSGATWSSKALGSEILNEVRRKVAPKLNLNQSFGRGTGLELGIASEPQALIGQLSQATAPPSTQLVHKVVGPISIPGIVRAELLRSQAQSRAIENGCVLGSDQAFGLGSVLDLEVLGGLIATEARPPTREVAQSSSTARIVKGTTPGRLGLQSETRQTIAPVTFFKGTPFQFTIEVLGEWALRAVADGAKGDVHYGPLNRTPETPVVRILGAKGEVIAQLTTQMLLGNDGLEIKIPGVAEIVVGENPRAIDGDASSPALYDPTAAAAAVDVVRVRLLQSQLADVRIGHMEAAVTVPSGGVQCPGLTVDQVADKPSVTPGGDFLYKITVTNPNDCALPKVKLVETPSGDPAGVKYEIVSVEPGPSNIAGGKATMEDIGPLGPGESKTVTIKVKVPLDSAPGQLSAIAEATSVCPAVLQPSSKTLLNPPADIPVSGQDEVTGPTIGVCVVPDIKGKSITDAKKLLEAAGCILGPVTEKPPVNPTDTGKVTDQGTPPGTTVPIGSPVPVDVGGPLCTVPDLTGKTPAEAKTLLENAGCKLGDVTNDPNGKPGDAGKITTSNPPAGDKVPTGTEVDVQISPPACSVPNVVGMTEAQAKAALEAAGCRIGDVTPGPDDPEDAGKITEQGTPSGTLVPAGTDVDITVAGPLCTVPNLVGMTEADAKAAVEAQGCKLATKNDATTNPAEIGKVTGQNPAANLHVPKGSTIEVNLGVQSIGTEVQGQQAERAEKAGTAAPALVRTGGVALGGLALWLLISGLVAQLVGSNRLWQLIRRVKG